MAGAGKVFIAIGFIIMLFAVVLFMGLFGLDPFESPLGGIIVLPIGAVFAASGIYVVTSARRKANILSDGVDGKAKILQWWLYSRSGGVVSYMENCDFELDVMVPGKPPYQVKHSQPTPGGLLGHLKEGVILPVKVQPEKPKQLMLDWGQVEDQVIAEDEKKTFKDRLNELEDAYKEGLVEKAEYESKRAEILKDL